MTRQEQIEEMAVIGCVRNPQAHTAEECSKCDFKQGMCNAYRHAEALYNVGYRKGETISYQAMIDHSYLDRINQLENRLVEVRKETAKEILQEWADDNSSMGLDNTFVKNIAKKYSVEVEE